ncbi:MAG TPA: c-type cytochrome [Candidatus Limnocylindrales bacterium]|nr:c-type cytochrome [Candidatus Limnocylindrales bacterium]
MAAGRDEYLAVCVSCHSPRYVVMQPFFPQRQWEETVDKMVKVYGAQMDPEQRSAIVQYLVATHGPDSAQRPAGDEDAVFTSLPKPSSRQKTAPLLTLVTESSEDKEQVDRGAELFKKDCAGCHGNAGRGNGFVAEVLWRKPKDLASTRYSMPLLSDVLWNGKRGTAMPSWRGVSQADLSALAAYVQSLHLPVTAEEVSPASLQRGNQLFLQNCAPCHGVSGDGKGNAASTLIPEPANFKLKQPDFDYISEVLREGIPGTAMPSWQNQISDPDRRALADFVRSLFVPPDSSTH